MKIPHIYFVSFKEKNRKNVYYVYFGLHRSWESTWNRIRELKIDKNRKYLHGTYLSWKGVFFLLMPLRIFHEDDRTKKK